MAFKITTLIWLLQIRLAHHRWSKNIQIWWCNQDGRICFGKYSCIETIASKKYVLIEYQGYIKNEISYYAGGPVDLPVRKS